jgi:hypothetical protein
LKIKEIRSTIKYRKQEENKPLTFFVINHIFTAAQSNKEIILIYRIQFAHKISLQHKKWKTKETKGSDIM